VPVLFICSWWCSLASVAWCCSLSIRGLRDVGGGVAWLALVVHSRWCPSVLVGLPVLVLLFICSWSCSPASVGAAPDAVLCLFAIFVALVVGLLGCRWSYVRGGVCRRWWGAAPGAVLCPFVVFVAFVVGLLSCYWSYVRGGVRRRCLAVVRPCSLGVGAAAVFRSCSSMFVRLVPLLLFVSRACRWLVVAVCTMSSWVDVVGATARLSHFGWRWLYNCEI
jgi:hypothetical protein